METLNKIKIAVRNFVSKGMYMKPGFHARAISYKYLEMPILIIWSIVTPEGKQLDACMKFAAIL